MSDIEDNIGPLFADEEDGDLELPPPLPPLEDVLNVQEFDIEGEGEGGAVENGERAGGEGEGDSKNESTTTKRRIVRKPIPKLDSTRYS